jgi:acid phosphatase family membrane protein YuiD
VTSVIAAAAASIAQAQGSHTDYAAAVAAGAAALTALGSGVAFLAIRGDDAALQSKIMNKAEKKGQELSAAQAAAEVKERRGRATNWFFAAWLLGVAAAVVAAVLSLTG